MNYLILILIGVLLPHTVFGEVRQLTLEQARTIAADHNRDIRKAKEYAAYVQGRYVEERSAALPQLSLNGGVSLSRDDSSKVTSGMTPRLYSRSVDLSLSQPLYTWGKVGAAIKAAEIGLKTADQQLRLYRQAAWRDVTISFYDVLLTKELHSLATENLAQKQRHQDEARRKFALGVATDYDVLAAEVAVQNARPEVIRTENRIRTTQERLRLLLALEAEAVDASGTLSAPELPVLPTEQALGRAWEQRPELADLRLRVGVYEQLVTIADAEDKPRLDLKGGAGWHWLDLKEAGQRTHADGIAWDVGVYLSFPFFDGLKSRGKVTQAKSDLRTKQLEEAQLRDSIALEVREAGNAVHEASAIVAALDDTVRQAERLLQMAEKGYEYGVKIRLEVDDAQLNLYQARSNLAQARRDLLAAQAEYQWAMGVAGE